MPPKRAASSTAPGGQAKRSRTSGGAAENAAAGAAAAGDDASTPAAPPPSKRWSAVSVSRNVDASFRLAVRDAEKANTYRCVCRPPFVDGNNDDDEWDDMDSEDEDGDDDNNNGDEGAGGEKDKEGNKKEKAKCDGGKSCVCNKPASEHPDHRWILTYGGYRKFIDQYTMQDLRDPDNFAMYTYNDHMPYGVLEVIQNLVLDYEEASNWQEQWWVCEALVLFLLARGDSFMMIDTAELAYLAAKMTGHLFLSMLSRLEAMNLLSDTSEVKNLGLIMTLYIKYASYVRVDLLGELEDEKLKKPSFEWSPSRWDDYIHAYANKYGIHLHGVDDVEELTAGLEDINLPAPGDHLWDWPRALKTYKKEGILVPFAGGRKGGFGGDGLDITSWTSSTRASYSFHDKDPLGKKERDAIKAGMVLSLA